MEFTRSQIAGLVLGYLKIENCDKAFDLFLQASPNLKSTRHRIKHEKFYPTRVAGKCLIDFLKEYASIYCIVQGRLEASNYYNEIQQKQYSLPEQLLYLLDNNLPSKATSSTPCQSFSNAIHIPTPGHSPSHSSNAESCSSEPLLTPKRKSSGQKGYCLNKTEAFNVSEALLTQTLLDNHELREKLAETINIVRNTPELAKNLNDDPISIGASLELDAVIKTVVEKTNEDPHYTKVIDDIIGAAMQPQTQKKSQYTNTSQDSIEEQNNDAIQSIMAAVDSTQPVKGEALARSSDVFVYDGTLDSYLKVNSTQPHYLSVMQQQAEPKPAQYYVNVKNLITDTDILTMPTVIVNEATDKPKRKRAAAPRKRAPPKARAAKRPVAIMPQPQVEVEVITIAATPTEAKIPTPKATSSQGSHVRNLNFTTPMKAEESGVEVGKRKAWDEDLRCFMAPAAEAAAEEAPKRKRRPSSKTPNAKRGGKKGEAREKMPEEEVKIVEGETKEEKSFFGVNNVMLCTPLPINDIETPLKELIPRTPCLGAAFEQHGTPLNSVIEEHLKGVDFTSIATPVIPITPGFSLTPFETYQNRPTDYSTSSSYYQPSDNENRSLGELIQEAEKQKADDNELKTANEETFQNLQILSDVVIQQEKVDEQPFAAPEKKSEHVKKFNSAVIGKKNLNLMNKEPTAPSSGSSSSSSDSDSDESSTNRTVIPNEPQRSEEERISEIVSTVKICDTLSMFDKGDKEKAILQRMAEIRDRTIDKMKKPSPKKVRKRAAKPKAPPKAVRNGRKKKEEAEPVEQAENEDEEQDLVKGLWKRGIHLIPNKTKANEAEKKEQKGGRVVKEPKEKVTTKPERKPTKRNAKSKVVVDKIVDKGSVEKQETVIVNTETTKTESVNVTETNGLGMRQFDDFIKIDGSDMDPNRKLVKDYDLNFLNKRIEAQIFVERFNRVVTSTMTWTKFEGLMELPKAAAAQKINEDDDGLMDFALTADLEQKPKHNQNEKAKSVVKTPSSKRRKRRISEEEPSVHPKRLSSNIKLLNKIGMDAFLNTVHGN